MSGYEDDIVTDELKFAYSLRVRFHETDQQGIVYHSRYLEYLDVAMTEFFRFLGWDYPDLVTSGFDPSLVKTELNFLKPAVFDEMIDIAVNPQRVGRSSLSLAFVISRPGSEERLLSGLTVYVNVDPMTRTSRPIPSQVRAALERMVEASDGRSRSEAS